MTPYSIFISSPSGLDSDRSVVDEVVRNVAAVVDEPLGLFVLPRKWEQHPATMKSQAGIQHDLNAEIHQCKAFVLLLADRHGSKEKGHTLTNTHREFEEALLEKKRNPGFQIFAYFKKIPKDVDPGPQRRGVEQFKRTVKKSGVLAAEYESTDQLRLRMTEDLYKVLLNFRKSTFKVSMLRRFWRMGAPAQKNRFNTMIIYPPASPPCAAKLPAIGSNSCGIVGRLAPLVVFEDHKAILGIQKSLQVVGVSAVGDCSVDFLQPEFNALNRIWLCLPRNAPARKVLHDIGDRCKFEVVVKNLNGNSKSTHFIWKHKRKPFPVYSPQEDYKNFQIKTQITNCGEDTSRMVLRDYAIIARYHNPKFRDMDTGWLQDYFFAGIRGLGTWGAAWFVSGEYRKFEHMNIDHDQADVELLLEVTYVKGVIKEVKNVSDKPADYFSNQMKSSNIKATIQKYL
jgi:hypothetical protein